MGRRTCRRRSHNPGMRYPTTDSPVRGRSLVTSSGRFPRSKSDSDFVAQLCWSSSRPHIRGVHGHIRRRHGSSGAQRIESPDKSSSRHQPDESRSKQRSSRAVHRMSRASQQQSVRAPLIRHWQNYPDIDQTSPRRLRTWQPRHGCQRHLEIDALNRDRLGDALGGDPATASAELSQES